MSKAAKLTIVETETGIAIDKHIPPPNKSHHSNEIGEAFKRMEIGDSFFVPVRPNMKSQQSNLGIRGRYLGIKVTTRKVTENGILGFRVWRIE